MIEGEFGVKYDEKTLSRGGGKYPGVIFIDHLTDLWAEGVPGRWICRVLDHCATWPCNEYVFQTKNPGRYLGFLTDLPERAMLGCTIETNRDIPETISKAPQPSERAAYMEELNGIRPLFVTVEPILDFDVPVLGQWLTEIDPDFVNIGADSKGHGLPEPSAEKIGALIDVLNAEGIEIREKHNLGRILK
jgi:protein gp37